MIDQTMALDLFLLECNDDPENRPDSYIALAARLVADELKAAAERLRNQNNLGDRDHYDLLADVAAWRDAVGALKEANDAACVAVGRMERLGERLARHEQKAGVSHD